MRRRLGVVTKALGAGAGLTLALSACGLNSSQPTPDGYMTAELATTITVSVAENGLVSRGLKGGRQTPDLRATSVLHQAGIPNLPAAHPEGLESVCETYADSIPPQQLADEVSHIFPDDEFGRAIAKLNCASLSPPSREPGMPSDPPRGRGFQELSPRTSLRTKFEPLFKSSPPSKGKHLGSTGTAKLYLRPSTLRIYAIPSPL